MIADIASGSLVLTSTSACSKSGNFCEPKEETKDSIREKARGMTK